MPKKVVWFDNPEKLIEAYQSVSMKFSFVNNISGKLTQCHQWVQCRDYLQDAVRTTLTGAPSTVYGFKFTKDNPTIDLNNMRMLISQKGLLHYKKLRLALTRALKMLNNFEAMAGVEFTTVSKVVGDPEKKYHHVYMLTGPKMWLSSPHLISMFTLIVRLGDKEIKPFIDNEQLKESFKVLLDKDNNTDNDISYLKKVSNFLDIMVTQRENISPYNDNGFSNLYYRESPIMEFHNRTGLVATCEASTPFVDVNAKIKELKNNK